jgi:two-component system KDP operon response regulator KdpE
VDPVQVQNNDNPLSPRRSSPPDGLVVDTDRRLLTRNDEVIRLTPKEYNLLLVLIEHAGKVLTHKQLLTTLLERSQVQNVQYLRVLVGQLRRKIERDPDHPRLHQRAAHRLPPDR